MLPRVVPSDPDVVDGSPLVELALVGPVVRFGPESVDIVSELVDSLPVAEAESEAAVVELVSLVGGLVDAESPVESVSLLESPKVAACPPPPLSNEQPTVAAKHQGSKRRSNATAHLGTRSPAGSTCRRLGGVGSPPPWSPS